MGSSRWRIALAMAVLCAHAAGRTPAARAQTEAEPAAAPVPAKVAVFRTATPDPALHDLAEALDPVVLSEVGKAQGLSIGARPPLDLSATQLALDCVGETAACLTSVASQADVELLLAPSLERAGDETVVTLLYYDARFPGALRNASRRHRGQNVERAVLDSVPALLRELIGTPEPPPPAEAEPAPITAEATLAAVETEPSGGDAYDRPFPVVPVVLGVAGLALVGTGVAFGIAAKATEDDYAALPLGDVDEIERADERFEKAEDQALIANIGIIGGAAVFAFGAVLLALELTSDEPAQEQVRLSPVLAPGHAGLALTGRFEGAP